MNISKTEQRRKFLINIFFFAIVLTIVYFAVIKALPLIMPFLIAFLIAALLNHPSNKIHNRFPKISKGLAGGVMFTIIALLIIGLLVLTGVQISTYIKSFFKWISANISNLPAYLLDFKKSCLKAISNWPDSIRNSIQDVLDKYLSGNSLKSINVTKILTGAAGGVWTFAKSIPGIAFATIIALISTYFMFGSYDNVILFFRAQLSEKNKTLASDTKAAFRDTIGKYAKAYAKIVFITFIELLVAFYIMKIAKIYTGNYIPLIALGIAIIDILPVLGTGSVVVPWSIVCFIQKDFGLGIGLLITWGAVSVIRQYIEPKLVGKQIGLNPLVTLFCMYIGLKLFGAIGMFLLPITVIILKALQDTGKIHLWKEPVKVNVTADEKKPAADGKLFHFHRKKKGAAAEKPTHQNADITQDTKEPKDIPQTHKDDETKNDSQNK